MPGGQGDGLYDLILDADKDGDLTMDELIRQRHVLECVFSKFFLAGFKLAKLRQRPESLHVPFYPDTRGFAASSL